MISYADPDTQASMKEETAADEFLEVSGQVELKRVLHQIEKGRKPLLMSGKAGQRFW